MAAFRLPRLPVNWLTSPDLFRRYWDEAMSKIEETLNAILNIPAIEEALAELDEATQAALAAAAAAEAVADGAVSTADGAQNTATSAALESSIVNSYITGFTPPVISVDSAGLITIANHTRVYGDASLNPSVSVTGNTISTSGTVGQVIRVYYDDASRAGGAVTYQFTVDPAAPPVQGGNRHSVGVVVVPAAGTENGNYLKPPGWVEQ